MKLSNIGYIVAMGMFFAITPAYSMENTAISADYSGIISSDEPYEYQTRPLQKGRSSEPVSIEKSKKTGLKTAKPTTKYRSLSQDDQIKCTKKNRLNCLK